MKRTVVAPSASSKSSSISCRVSLPSQSQVKRQAGRAARSRCRRPPPPYSTSSSRVAHHHAHGAADAQVDLGLGRLPVVLGVPPAPHHLLAGPRVEHRLRGRLERALDAQRVLAHRSRSRRRTQRYPGARHQQPAPAPASGGRISSSGTPPTCAITRRPAVLVVEFHHWYGGGLRVALGRVLPLLLAPERGDVEVGPGGAHRLVAAARR